MLGHHAGGFMDGIDPGIVLSNGYTQVLESKRYGSPLPMDHILTYSLGSIQTHLQECEQYAAQQRLALMSKSRGLTGRLLSRPVNPGNATRELV